MAVNLGPKIPIMVSGASGDTYLTQGNAMLRALQPLLVANVINITTTTPPTTPNNGDTYIVAAGATGDWAGHAQSIAYWSTDNLNTPSGEWEFYTPVKGWIVGNQANGLAYIFGGSTWGTVGGGGGGGGGVGTSPKTTFIYKALNGTANIPTQSYAVASSGTYQISYVITFLDSDATATVVIANSWNDGVSEPSNTGTLGPGITPGTSLGESNNIAYCLASTTIDFAVTITGATGTFHYNFVAVVEQID